MSNKHFAANVTFAAGSLSKAAHFTLLVLKMPLSIETGGYDGRMRKTRRIGKCFVGITRFWCPQHALISRVRNPSAGMCGISVAVRWADMVDTSRFCNMLYVEFLPTGQIWNY